MAVITHEEAPQGGRTPRPPVVSQTFQTPVSTPNPEVPESSHHPALRNMGVVDPIRITQTEDTTATLSLQMTELRQYMQLIATHVAPQAMLPTPTLGITPINENHPPLPPVVDNNPRVRTRPEDVENSVRSSGSNSHARSREWSRRDEPRRVYDPNGRGAFPGDARSNLSRSVDIRPAITHRREQRREEARREASDRHNSPSHHTSPPRRASNSCHESLSHREPPSLCCLHLPA